MTRPERALLGESGSSGVAAVVTRVLQSAKYRHVDPLMVERLAISALRAVNRETDAVKLVKRRLHQSYGAFTDGRMATVVDRAVDRARTDPDQRAAAFEDAMKAHASAAERLDFIEQYAAMLLEWCGALTSVADLGCGLGPLAIPWLTFDTHATYWCCDIDVKLVSALNRMRSVVPVELQAETCDLAANPSPPAVDVCLMLKLIPTLDAQVPGAANDLVRSIRADHLVVSVPAASLGGRRRYSVDPVEQVAAEAEGTTLRAVHDRRIGPEHYVHLCDAQASEVETST